MPDAHSRAWASLFSENKVRRAFPKPIFSLFIVLLIQLSSSDIALGTETARALKPGINSFPTLPLASSPTKEFGGVIAGEFERRTIGGQRIYARRICLDMGYSPAPSLAVWVEGGIASLQLFTGGGQPMGAYGPAFGVGWIWAQPKLKWSELTPFLSGRATYFQSKLSDDELVGASIRSRRSRFEWTEATMLVGLSRPLSVGPRSSLVYGAFGLRRLSQVEYRSVRSGASYQRNQYNYSSGFGPEGMIGWQRQFSHRITLRIGAEVNSDGGRLTIAIGQWGAP